MKVGIIIAAVIVILALLAILAYLIIFANVDLVVRLAVIIVALWNLILLTFLILIAILLWRIFGIVHSDLPPILGSVRRTTTTVEGTADFVSTTAVTPLVRAVSLVFAATRFLQVLLGGRTREAPRP